MRNKAYDVSTYRFTHDETVLPDTNVWLYLFPAPTDRPTRHASLYSAAFKRMLTVKVPLAVDALVLGEYLNRYCRIEWEGRFKQAHPNFKSFRKSPDFLPVGQTAASLVRQILKLCYRHDSPFRSADIEQVLGDFARGAQDINDGLLVDACRQRGWKLLTHDGDFTDGGIDVLTGNPKLLVACP